MVNLKNLTEKKVIRRNSRHLRFNWTNSPESSQDSEKLRFYFDIVDDKFREEKIKRILDEVQELSIINFSFEEAYKPIEGSIPGTGLKYLCKIYDSNCSSKLVRQAIRKVFGDNWIRDPDLYDRIKEGTSLEKYLESIHHK